MNIITNEWMDAEVSKPFINRPVLVRSQEGKLYVAKWKGFYWVNANSDLRNEPNGISMTTKITHFYMFEKYNENDIL